LVASTLFVDSLTEFMGGRLSDVAVCSSHALWTSWAVIVVAPAPRL